MGDMIQFVDTISADSTVLLDLNDDSAPWAVTSFQAPPPLVRRAVSSSMIEDGDRDVATVRPDRLLTLGLDLICPSQDVLAAELQKLARILDRPASWLRYKPTGASNPVFFRVKRGDIAELVSNLVQVATLQGSLTLPADPYAYGLPLSGTATVNNDSTVDTNPMSFELNDVRGDAVVFPRIVAVAGRPTTYDQAIRIASASGPRTEILTAEILQQAQGGWTTSTQSSSTALGGSFRRWTAGSTPDPGLIGFANLSTVSPGEYRVMVRARSSVADSTLAYYGSSARQKLAPDWRWMDLGVRRLPASAVRSTDFPPDSSAPAYVQTRFEWAGAATNGATVDLDQVLLLPAPGPDVNLEGRCMKARATFPGGYAGTDITVGGPAGIVGDGELGLPSSNPWTVDGGFPVLVPGDKNRVYLMIAADGIDDDAPAQTVDVAWTYYPRYLYLRPVAS